MQTGMLRYVNFYMKQAERYIETVRLIYEKFINVYGEMYTDI